MPLLSLSFMMTVRSVKYTASALQAVQRLQSLSAEESDGGDDNGSKDESENEGNVVQMQEYNSKDEPSSSDEEAGDRVSGSGDRYGKSNACCFLIR